jgi:hypothetical protein
VDVVLLGDSSDGFSGSRAAGVQGHARPINSRYRCRGTGDHQYLADPVILVSR